MADEQGQVGPVADEPDWAGLGAQVKKRREEQRLAQGDLAARGGPGEITVRKIERGGPGPYRGKTKAQLERSLLWRDGVVDRILDRTVTENDLLDQVLRPEPGVIQVSGIPSEEQFGQPRLFQHPPAADLRGVGSLTVGGPPDSDLAAAAALVARLEPRERTDAEQAVYAAARVWLRLQLDENGS